MRTFPPKESPCVLGQRIDEHFKMGQIVTVKSGLWSGLIVIILAHHTENWYHTVAVSEEIVRKANIKTSTTRIEYPGVQRFLMSKEELLGED